MTWRTGALFAGYGGLEMAVNASFGSETAWVSDIDPGACKILAHHWPSTPNLGDITRIDWSQVEPVDILTGGFPCQDLSHAGKRAGLKPGTRSGLWSHMAYAIQQLRPRYVIAENVRGLLSASADSDLEPCPWCLGGSADGEPALRALGCVLGDLAELGYDTQWTGLRAADIGAPHGRFRVFVAAADTLGEQRRRGWDSRSPTGKGPWGVSGGHSRPAGWETDRRGPTSGRGAATDTERSGWDGRPGQLRPRRWAQPEDSGHAAADADVERLARAEPSAGRRPESADDTERRTAADADDDQLDKPEGTDGSEDQWAATGRAELRSRGCDWGPYEPAIRRWERVLGRPAPAPTEPGPKGGQRLSPRLVEWMMGLPEGHVTAVLGLTRNEQIKALGNGVVPQQAYAALQMLRRPDGRGCCGILARNDDPGFVAPGLPIARGR